MYPAAASCAAIHCPPTLVAVSSQSALSSLNYSSSRRREQQRIFSTCERMGCPRVLRWHQQLLRDMAMVWYACRPPNERSQGRQSTGRTKYMARDSYFVARRGCCGGRGWRRAGATKRVVGICMCWGQAAGGMQAGDAPLPPPAESVAVPSVVILISYTYRYSCITCTDMQHTCTRPDTDTDTACMTLSSHSRAPPRRPRVQAHAVRTAHRPQASSYYSD
eukprot:COSAG05_NODE_134_length_17060_cov_9.767761_13_plen_220_part_00